MIVLEGKNISKSFLIQNNQLSVLKNINLKIKQGEFIAITGSSGCGKSTLLSILAGLDIPTSGCVKLLNQDITKLSEDQMARLRNEKIGFIFQSFYLIPSLTAYENIVFPSEINKIANNEFAANLIKQVGMDKRKESYPIQLSGGEKQRIAIARSLINNPSILFADEPTGNLDEKNTKIVMDLLMKLRKEFNLTIVIVTHEKAISDMADKVYKIDNGKIVK